EVQAHLTGDEPLRLVDERVERLAQRRVPQAVVDEFGVPDLEPLLLAGEVALVGDRFEIGVRLDERETGRTLVRLAALDADAAILDHVETATPIGADRLAH